MGEKQKTKLSMRPMTFFPPFILLSIFVILSIVNKDGFLGIVNAINNAIIAHFGWAASILALVITVVAVIAAFSKF